MKVVTSRSEDQLLVDGLRQGDKRTLEKIYRTFFTPIYGFIKKNGGNADDAKDVFQEGLMVMYRLVQKDDFALNASFLSLLYPICRNIWFKSVRKRPFYVEVDQSKEAMEKTLDSGIEEVIHARSVDTLFRTKLNLLGEQCRKLINLFFEGNSMREIVEKLGLSSVSFAKKKKFQCKEKLVGLVKADPIYNELKN